MASHEWTFQVLNSAMNSTPGDRDSWYFGPRGREEPWESLRRAVIGLACESEEVPSSIYIKQVNWASTRPVRGGYHADIYKGSWDGKEAAIKEIRLHVFRSPLERSRATKVSTIFLCSQSLKRI